MKHYTLAEHHTFCVESGIPNGEVWKEVAKLGLLPEGIYHNPATAFNTQSRAQQKKHRATPEHKAKEKIRRSKPEFKAKKRAYLSRDEVIKRRKEVHKIYCSTPEYRKYQKEYRSRPGYNERRRELYRMKKK